MSRNSVQNPISETALSLGGDASRLPNGEARLPFPPSSSSDGRERGKDRGEQAYVQHSWNGEVLRQQPVQNVLKRKDLNHEAEGDSYSRDISEALALSTKLGADGIKHSSHFLQENTDLHMQLVDGPTELSKTKTTPTVTQEGTDSTERTWSEIAAAEDGNARSHFSFSAQRNVKRQQFFAPQDNNFRDSYQAYDWIQDDLRTMCKLSASLCQDKCSSLDISIPKDKALNAMYDLQNFGIICYFMGRLLKGYQLHAWARTALGEGAIKQFIFLGKGFYVALCSEAKYKFMLVEKAGVWGNGHFAMIMPWTGAFDPMQALMHFCPVWVTLQEVPTILLPFITDLAAALGKILYVPKLNSFVMSRNIRICVLWSMRNHVPGRLKVDLGMEDPMYVQVAFSSFPNACYKCHQIGHFAKFCSGLATGDGPNPMTHSIERKDSVQENGINRSDTAIGEGPIFISLESKEERVDLSTKPVSEHDASLKSIENVLSNINNSGDAAKQKRKQKKKRKTKKLEDITENQTLVSSESEHNQKIDAQTEQNQSEKLNEEKENLGESTLVDENEVSVQSQPQEMEREEVDEVKEEQLGRVPSNLHNFYNEVSHKFIIPGFYERENKKLWLKIEGKLWEATTFFQEHKLDAAEVNLLLRDGTKANFVPNTG